MGRFVLRHAELQGELVRLRPLRVSDAPLAFGMLHGREEITRWLAWDGPRDLEEVASHYEQWRICGEDTCDYHMAICPRGADTLCGAIGARFIDHPDTGDLGYWVEPGCWGRGYASEAIKLMTWLCFRQLAAAAVSARVFAGNAPSRRALEKNGFALERLEPAGMVKLGQPVDLWHMRLERELWERRLETWRPVVERVELDERGPWGAGPPAGSD